MTHKVYIAVSCYLRIGHQLFKGRKLAHKMDVGHFTPTRNLQ